MKVAVVYPEVYEIAKHHSNRKEFPPFGVLYLAASMEQVGIDARLFKVTQDKTKLDLRGFDAVAFSVPSSVTYPIVKASRFSSLYDDPLIMVGGVHTSIFPQQTLIDLMADVVCIGEGDITILEILDNHKMRNFSSIKGICYLDNSRLVLTSPRPLIKDIDILPLPARHLMKVDDFVMNNRLEKTDIPMTHIMFSRGCPFSCYFCAALQKKIQFRSGDSIRRELVHLKNTYGIKGFSVVDDNSIVDKKRVRDICESIVDLKFKWITLSRVDTVDKATLQIMKDSGCIEIAFGVESASQRILNRMNKKISVEQIRNAILTAYSVGLNVKVFLIHGFPGENLETTRETLQFLQQVTPMINRVSLFRFVPLPGTYVFNHPSKFGLHHVQNDYNAQVWNRYHIHHNNYHWWGTKEDFNIMNSAYSELKEYVQKSWSSRFS